MVSDLDISIESDLAPIYCVSNLPVARRAFRCAVVYIVN